MSKPKGSNDSSSKEIFKQREVYKDSYPTEDINPIDLWGDHKLLYGRVDVCGNPIFLRESSLVQLPEDSGEALFALDIVYEALQDVYSTIAKAELLNRLDTKNSKIFPLKPVKAFQSLHQGYHNYFELMFQVFNASFVTPVIDKKILNYNTFEKQFLAFYKLIRNDFIFTRSAYITSKRSNPLISGLIIEFSEDDHGNDKIKHKKYVRDVEFNFYRDTLKRYGFVLDKNAPWRIIADLESEPMKERISLKGHQNLSGYFENNYYQAHREDIDTIAGYMWQIWSTFVALNPVITEAHLSQCGPGIVSNTIQRQRLSIDEFRNIYGMKHWIKLYIQIRNLESKKDLPDKQIKLITKNALETMKYKGDIPAVDYVQQVFGGFIDQISETKPLTEQEIAATMQSVQDQVTQTTGY